MSAETSPLGAGKASSDGRCRLRVLKAATASVVGATALALAVTLPASGQSPSAATPRRAAVTSPGALTQLPGRSGCLVARATPRRGCHRVRALRGPGALLGSHAVASSPDGKHLYVASARSHAIAVFRRNHATGRLTQRPGRAGCVAAGGAGGCGLAVGLAAPNSVAVSPDGKNVYATSAAGSSLAIFHRNRVTGTLTQLPGTLGCFARTARPRCASARALIGPDVIAVSPDGKNVYVGAFFGDAAVAFSRSRATGALTQLPGSSGCIAAAIAGCASGLAMRNPEGLAVSGDGKNVYLAAPLSDAVDVFTRDPAKGALTQATDGTGCLTSKPQSGCATARALRGVDSVTISADDRNVYLTGLSVAILTRAPDTGDLSQRAGRPGCVQPVRVPGCALGRPLLDVEGLAISPDGANVYVTVFASGALDVFDRAGSTGALRQKTGRHGCFTTRSLRRCTRARGGVRGVSSAVVSPDGKYLYAVANLSNSLTAFRIKP